MVQKLQELVGQHNGLPLSVTGMPQGKTEPDTTGFQGFNRRMALSMALYLTVGEEVPKMRRNKEMWENVTRSTAQILSNWRRETAPTINVL